MNVLFNKYQGTGNDFVMIDQRSSKFISKNDTALIAHLCDRRFGIGGDGLILLENSSTCDFKMIYFNADGRESSMCGNGGRCIVAFAASLGVFEGACTFEAIDGTHEAFIKEGLVHLKMSDVEMVSKDGEAYVVDTGSPHYVQFIEDLNDVDIYTFGRSIRYNKTYESQGINVNLSTYDSGKLEVLTYERGVENETFSCGTGVTACVIAASLEYNAKSPLAIGVKGGELMVSFENKEESFTNLWLIGPAKAVFSGEINVKMYL